MRTAETIQKVVHEAGRRGLPLTDVYRMLYIPELYLIAYGKLYRNKGAMTPGVTGETVDGMSQAKIDNIIELLRYERYRWMPAKRVYIPKAKGGKRPLGLPPWSDKLLQEVMRMILEAYYEPKFSSLSCGFRSGRGPHTALREIYGTWKGTRWFIEGDIKGCFDNIDHKMLLDTIRSDIHDERFIRLLKHMLDAGYMEDWVYGNTYSGTPQGGVISPILSNIYLNKLDEFVEKQLLLRWNKGKRRTASLAYVRVQNKIRRRQRKGNVEEAKYLRKIQRKMPSYDTNDPGYRRLRYVRYADDFLLGFAGPKSEAQQIKEEIRQFLEGIKLEMSDDKTLITHAASEKAKFLGYEVHTLMADSYRDHRGRRAINSGIGLRLPQEVIDRKCKLYMQGKKPVHKSGMLEDDAVTIASNYQSVYRGMVNYWKLAYNLSKMGKLRWIMQQSLTKTLAAKFKTSTAKIYSRYHAETVVEGRKYKILRVTTWKHGKEATAIWGAIPLVRDMRAELRDQEIRVWNGRTELVQRMTAKECEWCGDIGSVQVHHIRGLRDLEKHKGREVPMWKKLMAARRRKTMVLCRRCHVDIEHGLPMSKQPSGTGFMQTPTKRHDVG